MPRPHVSANFCCPNFYFGFKFICVHTSRFPIIFESFSPSTNIRIHSSAQCFWERFCLLSMGKTDLSIGHVYLSHPGKTGSDSVTSAYPISHCIQKFPLWRPNSKFSGYGNRIRRIRVDASRIRKKKHVGVVCTRERQRNMPNCKTHMRGVQKHCNCWLNLMSCSVLVLDDAVVA